MIWIYDCEIYPNYFSVIFKNPKSQEIKEFIIFEERNDLDNLYYFINDLKKWFIGYNSYNFDNQLLNHIYKCHSNLTFRTTTEVTKSLYDLAMLIITSEYREYIYNLPFKFLDLMHLGRYKKSLKLLGVSLKWHKIQDLPILGGTLIKKSDVPIIRDYNLNDVLITEQLYKHLQNAIQLRCELSEMYNLDLYSKSDTTIADLLLKKFYSETTGLPVTAFKNLRTERNFVKFDWVIFEDIDFQTPILTKMLEEMKGHTYFKAQPFYSKKICFDDVYYKLGVGGIHSMDKSAMFEETEDEYLIEADISGMYPTTMVNHELKPAHLDDKFIISFKQIHNKRKKARQLERTTETEGLKLVLNAAVGKTRSKYSWLYDPLVNLQVTVNGQLYTLMLIEQLVLHGFKVISANTDGIITKVSKIREKEYYSICKNWEEKTSYILEYNYYKKYIRRDVNNYISVLKNGKIKTKGVFTKEFIQKFNNATDPLNKGYDKPIVSIALYEHFINQKPIEETIRSHRDIYDFCIAKKIDKKFINEFHYIEDGKPKMRTLQKSVRYYVSKRGGTLLKTNRKENQVENYEVNKNITIFNNWINFKDFKKYDIDYNYYIHQTQKVIDEIVNQQLTLF